MEKANNFGKVTLLITHYNRSKSLGRLLEHLCSQQISFGEIVVSDDGSKKEHFEYIQVLREKYRFNLVSAVRNSGLGNNINKGQRSVRTEYTMYVQEDFLPLKAFKLHLSNGLRFLEENNGLDMVRFYSYVRYPKLVPYRDGFAEMIFDKWSTNIDKATLYSDHPHLRRSSFLDKFGDYSEYKNPEKTEYDMMISFIKKKGRSLILLDYKSAFDQVNTNAEPSTMKRKFWRNTDNLLLKVGVNIYRHLLFNYRLFIQKS